jgi:hypothetical protein
MLPSNEKRKRNILHIHILRITILLTPFLILFLLNSNKINQDYRDTITAQSDELLINSIYTDLEKSGLTKILPNLDIFTECVSLSAGIVRNDKSHLDTLKLTSIMGCEYLKDNNYSQKIIDPVKDYGRFWGGYQIINKIVILITNDINSILKIVFLTTSALIIYFIYLSIKVFKSFAILLVFPLIASLNLNPLFLLSHSLGYLFPLILCITILTKVSNKNEFLKLSTWIYFLFGFYFWFFNMLVYPILIFSMPLSLLFIFNFKFFFTFFEFVSIWFKMIFGLGTGILVCFTMKLISSKLFDLALFANWNDSHYWKMSPNFVESLNNLVWNLNAPLLVIATLISLFASFNKFSKKDFIFLILTFLPSLTYNLLTPEHTVHIFAVGSGYYLVFFAMFILRFSLLLLFKILSKNKIKIPA